MVHHPTVYARLLGERIAQHAVDCWLVNTGWSGGPYGVGKRMSIAHTRAMVNAALEGTLRDAEFMTESFFGLQIPTAVPDVPSEVLNPRNAWRDEAAYDSQARKLAGLFVANFKQYEAQVDEDVRAAAIKQ
jgi:phosphoenolpyruvate carboxykinase (ATP)